jgi:hypothetical protein
MNLLAKTVSAGMAMLVCAGWTFAQDSAPFQYKMKKGEKYVYQRETQVKQSQTIKDLKPIQTEITQNDVSVLTVEGINDKEQLRIKTQTKELSVKIETAGQKFAFDSKKKDNDKGGMLGKALSPLYERLADASLTFTINKQGKILELKGYKELVADVVKDDPIAKQFASGGTDEAAKMNIGEFFPFFKEKAVSPGDKWDVPFEIQLPKVGAIKGKKTYWYQGDNKVGNRTVARISISTELTADLNLEVEGAKITGKLSITSSRGSVDFDAKEGLIVSIGNEVTLSGNLTVSANGMEIPIAMEQTQRYAMNLVDDAPKK